MPCILSIQITDRTVLLFSQVQYSYPQSDISIDNGSHSILTTFISLLMKHLILFMLQVSSQLSLVAMKSFWGMPTLSSPEVPTTCQPVHTLFGTSGLELR